MFHTLRTRLIVSHILPALVIIPLMGLAMLYVLESRLLLPMVYRNLAKDATLMAQITRNQPVFWQSRPAAQALVDGVSPYLSGRVSVVGLNGRVVAASDTSVSDLLNEPRVELPDLRGVGQGEVVGLQQGETAEAFAPVYDLNGRPLGAIRLTTRVVTVLEQIYQLRYLLGTVMLLAVVGGVLLGSALAVSINRPIQRVTQSIHTLAQGDWQAHVEEDGPDEMRLLAGAVNTLVVQLNSLEKARRQLLANLVHELGRPLGAIRSAIQALRKGAGQDPQLAGELLSGLDSETARLQRLLEDLAELHEQVLGRLELNRRPVVLQEWLAQALSPWEAAAVEKGLDWQVDISPELSTAQIDPDRMAQALGNLLSNAVKFTPAGGQVTVRAGQTNEQMILEVADSGPGIPPEEQEKIFQPFYRGTHGRRIIQGMGLGLSIARDIVTAHGGELVVESEAGKGSRFIIRMPAERSSLITPSFSLNSP